MNNNNDVTIIYLKFQRKETLAVRNIPKDAQASTNYCKNHGKRSSHHQKQTNKQGKYLKQLKTKMNLFYRFQFKANSTSNCNWSEEAKTN